MDINKILNKVQNSEILTSEEQDVFNSWYNNDWDREDLVDKERLREENRGLYGFDADKLDENDISKDKIIAYSKIDAKLFDAKLKDYANSLDDTKKIILQTALEQGLLNQAEKNAIYKKLVESYSDNNDSIPSIDDATVNKQIGTASARLAEETVKGEKGFLDFSWYLNPDFYNKQQVKNQQNKITEQLQAGTYTGAAPTETDTEKGKKDLGEGYVDTQQCYLLNGVETIAETAKEFNGNGNFGGRIHRVRSDKPEMFFNNMGFPAKSNEELYNGKWNNFPNYFFYVTTRDTNGNNQKVDVKKAFLNDTKVAASITALDISFNGTNPASARSDIKVDIEITFEGGLNLLNTTLNTTGIKKVGSNEDVEDFKVVDIIIRPEFMRDGKGLSSYERKQYHPDYNRTELVLESKFVPGTDGSLINNVTNRVSETIDPDGTITSYISFGLAMVDHEVNYTAEAGGKNKTVIKLSYYSYVQTFLNLPYMDALGGREILTKRQGREDEMKNLALTEGKNVLKERKRQNKKTSIQEIQDNKSRIVKEIMQAGLLYKTEVTDVELNKIKTRAENDNYGYVGKFADGKTVERVTIETPSDKAVQDYQNETQNVYFFTLADLVAVLSDIFYSDKHTHQNAGTVAFPEYHPDFADKLKPKFLFLDIMVEDKNNDTVPVNLGDIPISIEWFSKFLEENYFKKEVVYAPFMSFLNILIENAFTKMIKETCFKDDPWDGSVRVTSFRALEGAWDSLTPSPYLDPEQLQNFSDKLGKVGTLEKDYNTIIVIHANKQGDHTRLIRDATNNGTSAETVKEFPLLQDKRTVDGSTKGSTLGIFLNFSKADAQYLRESRYFQQQADEFVAIGNVYNCTVRFKNNLMNWFLPGHIVIIDPYTADEKPWNNPESIGNRIGMTGFYLVTNVKHKLIKNGKDFQLETTLETKWIASVTGGIRGRIDNNTSSITATETDNEQVNGQEASSTTPQNPKEQSISENQEKLNKNKQPR